MVSPSMSESLSCSLPQSLTSTYTGILHTPGTFRKERTTLPFPIEPHGFFPVGLPLLESSPICPRPSVCVCVMETACQGRRHKAPHVGLGKAQTLSDQEPTPGAGGRRQAALRARLSAQVRGEESKAGLRPPLTMAWLNLDSISPSSQSKASPLSRNSSAMRREQSVERRWMLKRSVAFSCACRLRGSSPFTITSFLLNSLTPGGQRRSKEGRPQPGSLRSCSLTQGSPGRYSPSTTLMGCRSDGRRGLMWKIF